MSQRAVWILAALTALLVGYVLLFERTSVTSKELEQRRGRVLEKFVRDRVDRLELQRAGKTVVLERKPGEGGTLGVWKMVEPVAGEADQDAVDQILGELEWLSARRTIENVSEEDAKAFGLSAPRYRIWYRVGGERHLLAVGKLDVHSQGVYVRTSDLTRAQVVPKTLTEALDHPPGHFRNKDFLGGAVMAWVRKIERDWGDERLVITRAEASEPWWMEPSGETPRGYADEKRVDSLLSALNDLRATRYLEEGPLLTGAKVALAKPELALRVSVIPDAKREDQSPRLVDLRVAGPCPDHPNERLAQGGEKGPVVCVAADALAAFEGKTQTFRSTNLVGVDTSQIEAFELSSGARKLALKRSGEDWIAEGKEPVDREAVENWLAEVAAVRAESFVPLTERKETGRFSFTLAGPKQKVRVLFAAEGQEGIPVRRGEEPLLAIFSARLADLLDPAPHRFASLSPWSEQQPSEIGALEARAEAFSRALALANGAWAVAGKALAPEAELRVRELVKTLLKTRALGYVRERPRPEFGLDKPSGVLVLTRKAAAEKPASTLRLELGARGERGIYARFDGGPVLEVDARVLGFLRELAGGAASAELAPGADARSGEDHDDEHDEHGHDHHGPHVH